MRNSYIILLLFLTGCGVQENYHIMGSLPDTSYDGELIFLTPLVNDIRERVDSVPIINGEFSFSGKVKTPEIYIIRVKPALRLTIQDLIVVKEPGELIVTMGKNSSSQGTALNDSLQLWKEKKMETDTLYFNLYQKFLSADETAKPRLQLEVDSLHKAILDFHFNFTRNNHDNVAGEFVYMMMGGSFTPEQKKSLKL